MRIYGQFRDLKENLISVEITKQETGIQREYEIGDILDSTHHYCFDGKAPVKISRKCDDLFEPIISTSCKIKLRSNRWSGDDLFANGVGDIIVKVERQVNNQTELLFIGYVQPLSFNQNINKQTNIIDINCIDYLGFLKDRYLSTGNSPYGNSSQDDSVWKLALSQSKYRSFIEILQKIGIFGTTIGEYVTTMFIKDDTFSKNKYLSDNLWLGESADDEMNCQEILLELMKYMNSRIVSVNGRDYYIIENDNNTSISDNVKCYSNSALPDTTSVSNTGVFPKEDIANEQVTIDTCYNKIGVKCELETVDDVVSSPLKSEALKSPYINKQLMLREYMCDVKDGDLSIFAQWCHMVTENSFENVTTDKCKYKDWYFRYLDNNEWQYNNNMMNPDFMVNKPYMDSNNYIWQSRLLYDLGYTSSKQSDSSIAITRPYQNSLGGAYFVSVGSTRDFDRTDNSPNGNINTTNYLVIPVKGLDRGDTANDEANALAEYASLLQPYNTEPMISYQSNKTMNLSPADSQTTNYIVISGKLRCMPVYHTFKDKGRKNALVRELTDRYDNVYEVCEDYIEEIASSDPGWPGINEMGYGPNGKRAYYARFFDLRTPNQVVDMNGFEIPPNVSRSELALMFPPQDNSGLYKFQYRYNQISPTSGSYYDNLTHVPILCCRLYVTRADGMRKYVNQDIATWQFSWTNWVESSDATFCISVNPKLDDYIIGPEHEITSTIQDSMNINSSGLAIPIKIEDEVQGTVTFEILGPYNTQYDEVNKRTHSKWTQFWRGENPEDWTATPRCLLDRISNIWISQFQIQIDSDNAKNSTLNDGDLLYYSEDNKQYNNTKENIEFKISTALTSAEAAEMNVASGISFNNPTDGEGNLYTTGMEDRPECKYITTMYNLYSTPKKIVEYNCNDKIKVDELYRSVYTCDLMEHLGITGFSTIVLSDEMDLKNNRTKISLRQI